MRWFALLLVALITFAIVLVVKKAELVKDFWLWVIGFSGLIVHVFQVVKDFFVKNFNKIFKEQKDKSILQPDSK